MPILWGGGAWQKFPNEDTQGQVPCIWEGMQQLQEEQPPRQGVPKRRRPGGHTGRGRARRAQQGYVRQIRCTLVIPRGRGLHAGTPRVQQAHRDVGATKVRAPAVPDTEGGAQRQRLQSHGLDTEQEQPYDQRGGHGRHRLSELPRGDCDTRQARPDQERPNQSLTDNASRQRQQDGPHGGHCPETHQPQHSRHHSPDGVRNAQRQQAIPQQGGVQGPRHHQALLSGIVHGCRRQDRRRDRERPRARRRHRPAVRLSEEGGTTTHDQDPSVPSDRREQGQARGASTQHIRSEYVQCV